METLKQVLMSRDGLSSAEADEQIADARAELFAQLDAGEMPMDFMEDYFGLEPDYLDDLLYG